MPDLKLDILLSTNVLTCFRTINLYVDLEVVSSSNINTLERLFIIILELNLKNQYV